ncbi:conserved hypothetical protein [gamma proteobacterium NOR5-3]|nr:conserved hypothetical protein [gamma proteobacterium NOR5-3]
MIKHFVHWCLPLAFVVTGSANSWAAADPEVQEHGDAALATALHHDDAEAHSGHSKLGFPHQTVGVFMGDTTATRRYQGLTLGLEYEYRINERFGVGAIFEHVGGDFHTNVAVLPVAIHRGPWKVYAGPGIEDSEEEGSFFLVRLGLEYGFHFDAYEVSPQIDVDFVDGEHLFIFGVTIARPF